MNANCVANLPISRKPWAPIARNGDFYDRIFPVVLEDAKIYEGEDRIEYVRYWEEKKKALDEKMKSVSSEYLEGFREEIDLYADIRKYLPRLTDILKYSVKHGSPLSVFTIAEPPVLYIHHQ